MNGNPYLMDVFSAMQPGLASTTVLPTPGGGPAPNASGYPALAAVPPTPTPVEAPAAPPPPPAPSAPGGHEDASRMMSVPDAPTSKAPAPPPNVNAQQHPPEMLESTQPREFPLVQMGGGVIPAHEADLRGPTVKAAQEAYLGAETQAVQNVSARNEEMAQREYDFAYQQEKSAQARQAAIERSMAERQQELQDLHADFHQSVQALSQTAVDPNHFWATRTSGQRTMGIVGLALGGFGGGPNPAMELIGQAIDRDINSQIQNYQIKRDVVQGKQTAFAMAMQKYGNEDAARQMARAAALDVVAAQAAQISALNKGTETANRADTMMAQIQQEKRAIAEQWVKFIPAQSAGPMFVNPRTGVTYNMNQARELEKELRGYGAKREEIGLNTLGDISKEQVKGQVSAQAQKQQHAVVLPTGETFFAPTEKDAGEVRGLVESTADTRRLIAEAQKIRQNAAVAGVPLTPSDRGKLEQIQKNLVTGFAVQHKLGALSKEDMELAVGGTADLFSYGPKADAQLESLGTLTTQRLHTKLGTYQGAPTKASGKMPGSFTAHGGEK